MTSDPLCCHCSCFDAPQTSPIRECTYREIRSVLCDHLEGWDGEGGREGDARGKRYGNICICITDSLCYKAEANTPL